MGKLAKKYTILQKPVTARRTLSVNAEIDRTGLATSSWKGFSSHAHRRYSSYTYRPPRLKNKKSYHG